MRLYLKLALVIAVMAAIQNWQGSLGEWYWETSFTARCWLANKLRDGDMAEQLVEEAGTRFPRVSRRRQLLHLHAVPRRAVGELQPGRHSGWPVEQSPRRWSGPRRRYS